jgi:hypothetical protein
MYDAISVLEAICFAWLTYCTVQSVRRLSRQQRDTIDVVIAIHFIFCGLPLLLDLTLGRPSHLRFPGFADAAGDSLTRCIYCVYVSICPAIWSATGRVVPVGDRDIAIKADVDGITIRYRYWLLLVSILPLFLLFFAPDIDVYRQYSLGARDFTSQSIEIIAFHPYLLASCMLSVIAAAGVVIGFRSISGALMVIGPILALDAWLVGKRYIIAMELILIGYALWRRGKLCSLSSVLISGGAAIASILTFSMYYQSNIRHINIDSKSWKQVYDSMRIDYGRDDVIKTTIFAELNPDEMRILNYRGESLVIYSTIPIPRLLWKDKPLSYGTNMACESMYIPKDYIGWCMTTSVLEEPIANFSWLGMLIGPLIVSVVCRLGDSCRDGLIGAITAIVALLLMTVHLSAFAPVAIIWAAMVTWRRALTGQRRPSSTQQYVAQGYVHSG